MCWQKGQAVDASIAPVCVCVWPPRLLCGVLTRRPVPGWTPTRPAEGFQCCGAPSHVETAAAVAIRFLVATVEKVKVVNWPRRSTEALVAHATTSGEIGELKIVLLPSACCYWSTAVCTVCRWYKWRETAAAAGLQEGRRGVGGSCAAGRYTWPRPDLSQHNVQASFYQLGDKEGCYLTWGRRHISDIIIVSCFKVSIQGNGASFVCVCGLRHGTLIFVQGITLRSDLRPFYFGKIVFINTYRKMSSPHDQIASILRFFRI